MTPRPAKMCIVTAQASTVDVLYRGQLEFLSRNGFEITVACSPLENPGRIINRGLSFFPVNMPRRISPWKDLAAMRELTRFLREQTFDLVQACTPKGALVGVVAARRAGVPLVVHLLRGLAYQRQSPMRRWLLKNAATLPCRRADHVIAVGHELRKLAIDDGVCPPEKITVLGAGSSNGVDLERFSPPDRDDRTRNRRAFGLPDNSIVIGFVGRLTNDKGIRELLRAFRAIRETADRVSSGVRLAAATASQANAREAPLSAARDVRLLIVGSYEHRDRPPPEISSAIASDAAIRHVEWTSDVRSCYAAVDLVVLPTYREGFNNVILEAAAMGLPVVTSDTVGCREGVINGESGLLVPVADVDALAAAMSRLVHDVALRTRMGIAARRHVEAHFDRNDVWRRYLDCYRTLLHRFCPSLAPRLIPCAAVSNWSSC